MAGRAKQGASFGYTKRRGYHPILATRADTGEILHARLRKGSAGSQRGAERFVRELVARVRRLGAAGPLLVRADSGFWSYKTIEALEQHGGCATRSASPSTRACARRSSGSPTRAGSGSTDPDKFAGRGLRYVREDWQVVEPKEVRGKTVEKTRYPEGWEAAKQLYAQIERARTPEQVIGRLLQALIAAHSADEEGSPPPSGSTSTCPAAAATGRAARSRRSSTGSPSPSCLATSPPRPTRATSAGKRPTPLKLSRASGTAKAGGNAGLRCSETAIR